MLEGSFDEGIEVAIEYFLGVADFHVGTQVFDATLVQHIAADLVTPTHVGFGVFELLLGFHAFAHFKVVQT